MHKNQIKYLYSSFVFVLITVSCLSAFTVEAFSASHISYTVRTSIFNYNNKSCSPYSLEQAAKTQQAISIITKTGIKPIPGYARQRNCISFKYNKKSISLPANAEKTG